jgi:predicted short-subunit dehydrogenase-like oxidoreductase (DUF2520 family)
MPLVDARVIGPGRAGTSLAEALRRAGWAVDGPLGRQDDLAAAADGARLLVLAVPDGEIAVVAAAIRPGEAVVAHLAGSLGLDVLAGHESVASLHPLVALPDAERGAARLRGAWFATAGDPLVEEVVAALDGRSVAVADADRVAYHAAAAVASNHLVALLGQVERIAASIDVPLDAYLDLARGALDDVASVGPAAALTGPVSRGDWGTVSRHVEGLPESERPAYVILADAARRLAETRVRAARG